ncbi:MAG TPA: glycosyltransferase family 39 protein [Methanobacterium sp.]|nr:glycosyltransferase family 39 protein [Methanobacterium sp.]
MIKFEDKHTPWVFLIILIILVGLITYWRVILQLYLWPAYDTYDLLANAAQFAGKGIGYSDLLRPPLLPFLTSIYFMFDGLDMSAILAIDGLLHIFGCVGLYLLLKERFSPLISFIGGLLYATSPLILVNAAVGYNDVPSISLGIWVLYLTYLGVNRNSRFFYIVFPLAMLAFLTKYNMALLIFPIFFYILISWNQIKRPKDIMGGMFLGGMVLVPVLLFFSMKFGNPILPFMSFFGTSGGQSTSIHFAYNPDSLYFVKRLPLYMGKNAILIIFSIFLSLLFYAYKKMDNIRAFSLDTLIKNGNRTKLIIILVLTTILIATFGKLHYIWSEVILFAILYLMHQVSSEWGWDCNLDLLFLSWFATFFIFHSAYVTKDHRYFVYMIPPIIYFLVRGLSFSMEMFRYNFKNKNLTLYAFSAILVILMILFTFSQFNYIEKTNMGNKLFNEEVRDASNWLKNYDPDYKSKVIYADYWAMFAWHLKMDVGKMPTFRNNQTILLGAKDANLTAEDKMSYDQELNKINPDYYFFTWGKLNFTNYQAIHRVGSITIYKRVR